MPVASITKPAGSPSGVAVEARSRSARRSSSSRAARRSRSLPPLPMPTRLGHALAAPASRRAPGTSRRGAECSFATAVASPVWSPWPWVSSIASQRSIASPSGHEGLPENQGSMSTRAPRGRVDLERAVTEPCDARHGGSLGSSGCCGQPLGDERGGGRARHVDAAARARCRATARSAAEASTAVAARRVPGTTRGRASARPAARRRRAGSAGSSRARSSSRSRRRRRGRSCPRRSPSRRGRTWRGSRRSAGSSRARAARARGRRRAADGRGRGRAGRRSRPARRSRARAPITTASAPRFIAAYTAR